MKYFTFHIHDTGAIHDFEEYPNPESTSLVGYLYDDEEFNSLNDILHSTEEFIVNEKCLQLFKKCNIPSYKLTPVKVKRKELQFGLFKSNKSYQYTLLQFDKLKDVAAYDWINYEKSKISVKRGTEEIGYLKSNQELQKYKAINASLKAQILKIETMSMSDEEMEAKTEDLVGYTWDCNSIVFDQDIFDSTIDIFHISQFSWGTYISERFMNLLKENKITNIGFGSTINDLGAVWKPHFPEITFERNI